MVEVSLTIVARSTCYQNLPSFTWWMDTVDYVHGISITKPIC